MDKIFTQEELFWLDDVLPGTKIGLIRRLSVARHVHIPKSTDDDNDEPITVNKFYFIGLLFFLNKTNIIFSHQLIDLVLVLVEIYHEII
jgi:hypothetical protein